VPNPCRFFEHATDSLKAGETLLFAKPRPYVSQELFEKEIEPAIATGLEIEAGPSIRWSLGERQALKGVGRAPPGRSGGLEERRSRSLSKGVFEVA